MASDSESTFKLRCTLLGHSMDVRGVTAGVRDGGQEYLVSGSRDKKSKIWTPLEDNVGFKEAQTCEGHTNFVSCVCTVSPTQKYPSGLVLSGGHDHTVLGFEVGNPNSVFHLVGHKGTVCSIAAPSDSLIVTGSWDQTAKVWLNLQNVATLIGHTAAVWAVATLPHTNHILTGSADKEIRLWVDNQSLKIFKGHTDCVRALAVVDEERFLSGSNDASVRLWNVHGESLHIFYGHTNFIYSISLFPDGKGFASVGEDRSLRIWRETECKQVIFLPATSLWCVSVLQSGDVAVGSSDGTVRVFTNDPARFASPDDLKLFEDEVAKTTIAAQQDLGGMKMSELPGPEILLREGRKDGETKMVREGDKVACYSWSADERKWNKIGDVVGASGATQNTSGKVLHDGKEYDYVFQVELDGQGTLKLPYNITEDPWFAAQKFIHKNNLSQLFLDQVASFIIKNTKGMQLGTSTNSNFEDPFTGGTRYVPGTAEGSGSNIGAADPFTGANAYTTTSSTNIKPPTAPPANPLFPVNEYLRFVTAPNFDALKKKLHELQVLDPGSTGDSEVEALLDIGRTQDWKGENTIRMIQTCLNDWPKEKVFPVLDLLRLGLLNLGFTEKLKNHLPLCTELATKFLARDSPVNQMLYLRLLCNLFGMLTSSLVEHRSHLISTVISNLSKAKPNEVGASTLILNFSMVACDLKYTSIEAQTEVLMATLSLLEIVDDSEAIFRTLIAIGNLVSADPKIATLFRELNGVSIAARFMGSDYLEKIQTCASQIKWKLEQPQ